MSDSIQRLASGYNNAVRGSIAHSGTAMGRFFRRSAEQIKPRLTEEVQDKVASFAEKKRDVLSQRRSVDFFRRAAMFKNAACTLKAGFAKDCPGDLLDDAYAALDLALPDESKMTDDFPSQEEQARLSATLEARVDSHIVQIDERAGQLVGLIQNLRSFEDLGDVLNQAGFIKAELRIVNANRNYYGKDPVDNNADPFLHELMDHYRSVVKETLEEGNLARAGRNIDYCEALNDCLVNADPGHTEWEKTQRSALEDKNEKVQAWIREQIEALRDEDTDFSSFIETVKTIDKLFEVLDPELFAAHIRDLDALILEQRDAYQTALAPRLSGGDIAGSIRFLDHCNVLTAHLSEGTQEHDAASYNEWSAATDAQIRALETSLGDTDAPAASLPVQNRTTPPFPEADHVVEGMKAKIIQTVRTGYLKYIKDALKFARTRNGSQQYYEFSERSIRAVQDFNQGLTDSGNTSVEPLDVAELFEQAFQNAEQVYQIYVAHRKVSKALNGEREGLKSKMKPFESKTPPTEGKDALVVELAALNTQIKAHNHKVRQALRGCVLASRLGSIKNLDEALEVPVLDRRIQFLMSR